MIKITQKPAFSTKRLVLDAVMVALYVVLGFWKIPIGNMFRISVASFAVILGAMLFGPIDGMIIGFLGEFLSQVLGPYGLTQTTLLWCSGELLRGLLLGLMAMWLFKKLVASGTANAMLQVVGLLICCVLTGVVASLCNTLALYVDSKLFGYYSYHMVFGVLVLRLVINSVTSVLLGYISLPIIAALRKAKLA